MLSLPFLDLYICAYISFVIMARFGDSEDYAQFDDLIAPGQYLALEHMSTYYPHVPFNVSIPSECLWYLVSCYRLVLTCTDHRDVGTESLRRQLLQRHPHDPVQLSSPFFCRQLSATPLSQPVGRNCRTDSCMLDAEQHAYEQCLDTALPVSGQPDDRTHSNNTATGKIPR